MAQNKDQQEGLGAIPALVATTAVSTVSDAVKSEQGQKTIGELRTAGKWVAVGIAVYLVSSWGWKKIKTIRAQNFARENAGDPHLIAAAVIRESLTIITKDDLGILGWFLGEFNVAADEATLNRIAAKITDVKLVARAYKIFFDRELFTDIRNGLSTNEMQEFWTRINAPAQNQSNQFFAIGDELYVADKKGIQINKVKKDKTTGTWDGTNELYGNYKFKEPIGEIIDNGIYTYPEDTFLQDGTQIPAGAKVQYYIVQKLFWSLWRLPPVFYKTGVVIQPQVSNKKTDI